jgi:hypothetical protein
VQEVAGVGTGHVGDAADLALTPEELVVVEFGDTVEVDGVDGDHAAFAQAGKGGNDDVAAGGEGDGAVEFFWRTVIFCADPSCTERSGEFAVGFAARGNVNLTIPGLQDGDGEMGGGAESEESDAVSFLDAGNAKAAEADNSGAEERGSVERVEGSGDGKDKIGAGEGVFGVASVEGIAGEGGGVAEVLFVAKAVRASAVGAAEPGDADEIRRDSVRRCLVGKECPAHTGCTYFCFYDFADDLVAGDYLGMERGEFAFGDVEVGAADSAGEDAEEDLAWSGSGDGDFRRF